MIVVLQKTPWNPGSQSKFHELYIYIYIYIYMYVYTIHLSWCFGMGRQWCFLLDHGGFRVFQHQTPSPKWPSWHRSNSNSHPGSQPAHPHKEKTKKMTTEKALYIILQRPIRAKLYWWLLNLFFKKCIYINSIKATNIPFIFGFP